MTQPQNRKAMAALIDHSVLGVLAGRAELAAGCQLARQVKTAGVCVKPYHVAQAAELLKGSGVMVSTVISFPHGADTTLIKLQQALAAIADGADELDMVVNVAMLNEGDLEGTQRDIAAVVGAAKGRCVKVILECALLTDPKKLIGCQLALQAGACFVKTSTGFAATGATVEDVRLVRAAVGDRAGVKAAGGIRTLAQAQAMIEAGANRLGTSATAEILAQMAG
jgi:deoxyribose-phosphate aldolase